MNALNARVVGHPTDPPVTVPTVVQTVKFTSRVAFAATGSGTVTMANFIAGIPNSGAFPATSSWKFQKMMVYAPSSTALADNDLTVSDLLPFNDGFVSTDAAVAGQSRACVSYQPTHLDRLNSIFAAAVQNLFSWSTNAGNITYLDVVATVQVRFV